MDTQMTPERRPTFNQNNAEAMLKSGQVWFSGMQDVSHAITAAAQAHLDQSMTTWTALTRVKSLPEAIGLQAQYGRAMFGQVVADANTLTSLSMKLAKQTAAPITERLTLAAESLG